MSRDRRSYSIRGNNDRRGPCLLQNSLSQQIILLLPTNHSGVVVFDYIQVMFTRKIHIYSMNTLINFNNLFPCRRVPEISI